MSLRATASSQPTPLATESLMGRPTFSERTGQVPCLARESLATEPAVSATYRAVERVVLSTYRAVAPAPSTS